MLSAKVVSMIHRVLIIGALGIALNPLKPFGVGQQNRSRVSDRESKNDVSPYVGRTVSHPETISGLWETSNGHGGAVGIHLLLSTTVPATAGTLSGLPQSWHSLDVSVYEHKGAAIKFGDENYFSDSRRGGNVRFDRRRLTLHFVGNPSVDLDLLQQPNNDWVGRFHRGDFDSTVTLRRPSMRNSGNVSPIVGTWVGISPLLNMCVHVFQQSDSEFTGWSDSLQVGNSGMQRLGLRTAFERYGDLAKVSFVADGSVTFELHAFAGICCPQKYVGKLRADGNVIEGVRPGGPNQTPRNDSLRKMPADSCVE